MVQTICAATVVVLALLGLVRLRPLDMAVAATIGVSAALALQGRASAHSRWTGLAR
jgi:hypothetical protein